MNYRAIYQVLQDLSNRSRFLLPAVSSSSEAFLCTIHLSPAFFVLPSRTRPRFSRVESPFVVVSFCLEEFWGWMGGTRAFGL
jgi:hypothetical protein